MNLVFPEDTCVPPARDFAIPADMRVKQREGERSFAPTTPLASVPLPFVMTYIRQRIENSGASVFAEKNMNPTSDSRSRTQRLAALHSALSILCHVVATDNSGSFIYGQPVQPKKKFASSNATNNEDSSTPAFFLSDVYTTLRALRLEYEDVLQQKNSGGENQPVDLQSLDVTVSAIEKRIDSCVVHFESTILNMFVNLDRARKISPGYICSILHMLPQVFAVEKWPCALLQKEDGKQNSLKRQRPVGNYVTCPSVGDAATAIVLKALQEIKNSDCLRLLNSAKTPRDVRMADASLLFSFDELMTRALGGVYGQRGLYGALYDMKLLLYGVYATVPSEQEVLVTVLRMQFEKSLRSHYAEFLKKTGIFTQTVEEGEVLLPERTIFDANPLPKEDDATSYSDTQVKCLRLLDLLREVDVDHWFEYPVFDMANIELSSIEKWLRSASFGLKTDRDAFTALRNVLEKMVDNCVLSHGPTSPFSQAITRVRRRLVDAAREVGLLR